MLIMYASKDTKYGYVKYMYDIVINARSFRCSGKNLITKGGKGEGLPLNYY